jgi:hypothetical protein
MEPQAAVAAERKRSAGWSAPYAERAREVKELRGERAW